MCLDVDSSHVLNLSNEPLLTLSSLKLIEMRYRLASLFLNHGRRITHSTGFRDPSNKASSESMGRLVILARAS